MKRLIGYHLKDSLFQRGFASTILPFLNSKFTLNNRSERTKRIRGIIILNSSFKFEKLKMKLEKLNTKIQVLEGEKDEIKRKLGVT